MAVALNKNYGLHTQGSIVQDNVGWEFSRSGSDQNPLRDSLRLSPVWGFGSSCSGVWVLLLLISTNSLIEPGFGELSIDMHFEQGSGHKQTTS